MVQTSWNIIRELKREESSPWFWAVVYTFGRGEDV